MSDELPSKRSKRRPEPANDIEAESPLLSRSLRSAVLCELSPTQVDRERVQAGIVAALGGAPPSPIVKQVETSMATRAAQLKAATVVAGKSLATKLIVSGFVVATAAALTTGVVLRRSSEPQKAAVTERAAPRAAHSEPVVPATATPKSSVESAPSTLAREAAPRQIASARPTSSATGLAREHARPVAAASPRSWPPPYKDRRNVSSAAPLSVAEPSETPVPKKAAPQGVEQPAVETPPLQKAGPAVVTEAQPSASEVAASKLPPKPALTLGSELALVRGASDALDRKDSATALQLLARYAQNHPNGSLQVEAQALRVVALCAEHRPEAVSARDAFLRAHPKSALARRVRSACP